MLALRNNRFHQWNRYYLLSSVVLSFVLPLMKIPIPFFATAEDTPLLVRGVEMMGISDLYISRLNEQQQFHITWQLALTLVYVLVVAFLVFAFIKNIVKIERLKQLYPCEFIDGIQFYNTQEQGTPFSFFKNIFWNKRIDVNSEKGQQMLAHELAHVNEKHSSDKVFMEAMVALAWWNPVLYFIRRELSVIHEFIADKKASAGDENLQYASLLLMKAMGNEQFALANPFFHSQLKRRLAMLTTSNNPKFSYARRLMVLPLAAFALLLFSFKYKEFQGGGLLKSPVPLTVVIDAGHGGSDDGAAGINGIKEDDIALQLALQIKALSAGTNINVVLSRYTDTLAGNTADKDASLKYRTALAKENNADFFISLHMNSVVSKTPNNLSGIMAYISNTNTAYADQSRMIASGLLDELSGHGLPVMGEIKINNNQGVYVLDKSTVPAVVLEIGYTTNAADVAFIQQPKNQETIAKDILNALAKHGKKAKEAAINKVGVSNPGIELVEKKKELEKLNEVTIKLKKELAEKTPNKNDVPDKKKKLDAIEAENQPLYVVDGEIKDKNALAALSPNDIATVDVFKGESAITAYGEKGKYGVIKIMTKARVEMPISSNQPNGAGDKNAEPRIIFTKVEQPAEFPGGLDAWRRYLAVNLRYPDAAAQKNIQGAIKVQVTVNTDGSLKDIKALDNPGGGLAEEAERLLAKGPKWIPAKQNDHEVTYRFVQTITFQLQ